VSNVVGKRTIVIGLGVIVAMAAAMSLLGFSLSRVASASDDCINSLGSETADPPEPVSLFEIDPSANLKVDTAGCIDWLNDAGTAFRDGVEEKDDTASGANDESFGQGTAEDNPNPTIVTGSIPPNKSDLKAFGVFVENDEVLELFWARVQNPKGTTNMDFELNQNFCEADGTNCANNGPNNDPTSIQTTPDRLTGDKLITYDLSKGGTVPSISIRTWDDTAEEWGPATLISGTGDPLAIGSINTTTIPANQAGGLPPAGLGQLDPFTFGEAAISFEALFGEGACGEFGSAYLKSRSSDSFTSEIKDFVPPERVEIGNCPSGLITNATASVTLGSPISDTATLDVPDGTTGTIEFNAYGPDDADCSGPAAFTSTVDVPADEDPVGSGNYNSGDFTPTEPGTYRWTADFTPISGGVEPSSSECNAANETSTVTSVPSSLTTAQSFIPNDEATVSASQGGNLAGTVTFTVFESADCSGTALYTEDVAVSGASSQTVSTSNTTESTTSANVSWEVSYDSTNPAQDDVAATCVEKTALTIDNG
jgi:hypothetical protein